MFFKGSRRRKFSEALSLMRFGCGSARCIDMSLLSHESLYLFFYPTERAPNPPYPDANTMPYTDLGTCDCRCSVRGQTARFLLVGLPGLEPGTSLPYQRSA